MKVSFFPGCSLEGTAREYGESIEGVCKIFGLELEELPDWSCCGASSAHCTNEFLSLALPARNLFLAEKFKQDLVTPCAACFSRLKAAEKALTGDLKMDLGLTFKGEISVLHLLELFSREDFREKIKESIKRPLEDLKVVGYYGCLIVRPPRMTDAEHWENPQDLDSLVSLLGGESIFWPYKTECCGGSLVLTNVDIIHRLTGRLLDMAQEAEADCIVTACPLCQSNLDTRQEEIGAEKGVKYNLPVFYFTELLGIALGSKAVNKWFRRHLVDPRPLLKSKNLI